MTCDVGSIARLPIEFSEIWKAWSGSIAVANCVNVAPASLLQPTVIPYGASG
jgi:hypothetical protein